MKNRLGWAIAAILILGGVAAWAQQVAPGVEGSLAALTAEIRALRGAVEESGRRQTETHAMGVYLAAQQNRMNQLAQRLEGIRAELARAQREAAQIAATMTAAQEAIASAPNAQERQQAVEMLGMFKQQAAQAAEQEQRLRARELELYQTIQQDEARWTELVGRLETIIRR